MGKKKSGRGNGGGERLCEAEAVAAREFVLKVAMHCRCHGCVVKVRGAVRELTLLPGVEAADTSAAESSGEVRLLATADPERLRRRLRKATGKKVDLLLPKEPPCKEGGGKKGGDFDDHDAALQALLANLQLQAQAPARQQYGGQAAAAAWAANQQQQQMMGLGLGGAAGYGAAYPYPWPSSSVPSYYQALPGAGLGAYGYAPPAPAPAHGLGDLGYYYGGAPALHGY